MNEIDELSKLILLFMRAGAGVRLIFSFIKMIEGEETDVYKGRAKKAIKFWILAECIFELKEIAMHYFS